MKIKKYVVIVKKVNVLNSTVNVLQLVSFAKIVTVHHAPMQQKMKISKKKKQQLLKSQKETPKHLNLKSKRLMRKNIRKVVIVEKVFV